jgi:GrpB-like predicted nucleotidyltransferase (UPF0157 family)
MERHPSLDERFDPAIRLVDHDPGWAAQAQHELDRVATALGPLAMRLEHVGSTAVPGMPAKPILDLQLSVEAIEAQDLYVGALERLGYLFAPDPASPGYRFFGKPAARPRTHHLHVCESGSEHELRHVALRELLRADDREAAAYAALKRQLVARAPRDRLAYIAGKAPYVEALEVRALAWARARAAR